MVIGLNVNERESADPQRVVPGSLGISAWPIKTRRGPTSKAIQVSSFAEFKRRFFAEPDPDFLSYYVLKSLYDNAGDSGATIWVKRVVGAGAVAATDTADDDTAATPAAVTGTIASLFPLRLESGDSFVANIEGIGNQSPTFTGVAAQVTGSGATYAAVTAGHKLRVQITDQPGIIDVPFAGTENTQALYLAAINTYLSGGGAINQGGQTRLITDAKGTGATITVHPSTDADVLASLGFTSGQTNTGSGNVANIHAVTFAEFKSIAEAALTNGDGVVASQAGNGAAVLTSVATGGSATIQIVTGQEEAKFGFTVGTQTGAAGAAAPRWQITAGAYGEAEVGDWANDKLFYQVVAASSGLSTQRDLLIYYQTDLDTAPVLVERHKNLTAANLAATINHEKKGSAWVTISVISSSSLPDVMGSAVALSTGTPGANGATPAEALYNTAFQSFGGVNFQLLAAPDLDTLLHASNMEVYAAAGGKALAVFNAAQGLSDGSLTSTYASLLQPKSYLMGIRGHILVDDERGGTILVPAVGAVIGAGFIRKAREQGGYPHISPAGPLASIRGSLDTDDAVYDEARLDTVNKTGFNPVVFQPGTGTFLKTSRTFSTTDKWYSAHIRIQANYFKVSFLQSFSLFEQEPNNTDTRRRLRRSILRFMEVQFNTGGLDDEGGFDNNCQVKCDEDNNGALVRQARKLVCDTKYRPVEIAENVEINLIRTTEGIAAGEA